MTQSDESDTVLEGSVCFPCPQPLPSPPRPDVVGLLQLFPLADGCPHPPVPALGVHSFWRHITESERCSELPLPLGIYLFRYKGKWQMWFVLHAISSSRPQFHGAEGWFPLRPLSCPGRRLEGMAWVPPAGQLNLLVVPLSFAFGVLWFLSFLGFLSLEATPPYMDLRAACSRL